MTYFYWSCKQGKWISTLFVVSSFSESTSGVRVEKNSPKQIVLVSDLKASLLETSFRTLWTNPSQSFTLLSKKPLLFFCQYLLSCYIDGHHDPFLSLRWLTRSTTPISLSHPWQWRQTSRPDSSGSCAGDRASLYPHLYVPVETVALYPCRSAGHTTFDS